MENDGRVFKVVHADGREWDYSDLEKWALDNPDTHLIYCDMDGFYIDEYGYLTVVDDCGNMCYVGESEDMKVIYLNGGR